MDVHLKTMNSDVKVDNDIEDNKVVSKLEIRRDDKAPKVSCESE